MQIKNLMSENIITVDKDQNLTDALKLLRKHNVSRLPVTNNKELVSNSKTQVIYYTWVSKTVFICFKYMDKYLFIL